MENEIIPTSGLETILETGKTEPTIEIVPADRWDEFARPLYQKMEDADRQYKTIGEELDELDKARDTHQRDLDEIIEARMQYDKKLKDKVGDQCLEIRETDTETLEWDHKLQQAQQIIDSNWAEYWEKHRLRGELHNYTPAILELLWHSSPTEEFSLDYSGDSIWGCMSYKRLPDGKTMSRYVGTDGIYEIGGPYEVDEYRLIGEEVLKETLIEYLTQFDNRIAAMRSNKAAVMSQFGDLIGNTK